MRFSRKDRIRNFLNTLGERLTGQADAIERTGQVSEETKATLSLLWELLPDLWMDVSNELHSRKKNTLPADDNPKDAQDRIKVDTLTAAN